MAAVTGVVEHFMSEPNMEVVTCVASDGETYTSKLFGTIVAASGSLNVATGDFTEESISVTFSGSVATIELVGTDTTDLPVTLVLYGNLGN